MFGVVKLQSYKILVESWVSTSMYKNDTESYATIRELSLIRMDFLHTDYKLLAKSFVDMFTLMALLWPLGKNQSSDFESFDFKFSELTNRITWQLNLVTSHQNHQPVIDLNCAKDQALNLEHCATLVNSFVYRSTPTNFLHKIGYVRICSYSVLSIFLDFFWGHGDRELEFRTPKVQLKFPGWMFMAIAGDEVHILSVGQCLGMLPDSKVTTRKIP